ncbi:hypothetical protein [Actinomyces sp.]
MPGPFTARRWGNDYHHHSATAAASSTAATKAPKRENRRVPTDSGHWVEADREKISSSRSARARTLGRTAGGYEGAGDARLAW